MLIQLTKKCIDAFKINPIEIPLYEDSQYKWYGHLFLVNRRNLLVLMHVETGYNIVLFGFTTRQLKAITKQLNAAMRDSMLKLGIEAATVDRFFDLGGSINYSKTDDKFLITKIANFQEYIDLHKDLLNAKELIQFRFMEKVNHYYIDEHSIIQRFFNCCYNLKSIERMNAFEIIYGKYKFVLYEDMTFDRLAILLQPEKKYKFEFYSNNGKLKKGVCSELRFKYQLKMKRYVLASDTALKDLLYRYDTFFYCVSRNERKKVMVKRIIYDYPRINEDR